MGYLEVIKTALIFFPAIALIITIPFVLIQYHKYGSISKLKSFIIYSFILYLLCAFFLVILPLPEMEYVEKLTTPRTQLIPLNFIYEFITQTNFKSNILSQMYFYMPIFNILLTVPFGIYIKYLFKLDIKKTVLYSFLLSLFFEITQLTGLFFIYPRGYRLFDVDDLILNTLGGLIGYYLSIVIAKPIPDIDKVNSDALIKGMSVSGLKRTTSLFLDIILFLLMSGLISLIIKVKWVGELSFLIYYVIIPLFCNGSTIGQRFLNLKIVDYNNKVSFVRLLIRIVVFLIIYLAIPVLLGYTMLFIKIFKLAKIFEIFISILIVIIILGLYLLTGIIVLFTHKPMIYEKISKTKLVSTIRE